MTTVPIERHRPARWKQPLLHTMNVVRGFSNDHDPLYEEYDHDPVGFVRAIAEELRAINGIGEAFSRRLVVKKHAHYPDVAPEPDDEWSETQEHKEWKAKVG